MPFSVRKQGNKFQVVNSETGDVKGTFDSEADADKQLRALYANVPDAKDFHEIVVKSATAEMVPVDGDVNDDGPGHFHAVISSQKRDRDGDQLWADEWEQPLPDHIVINGDHDNNHIMSTVGSGTPTLESDNKIHVRGTYAETDFAQNTRKLVNGKHLRTLSCAYREKRGQKGVSRELVNASFVLVPSNTDCVVLDSKSYEMPTPLDVALRAKKTGGTDEGAYSDSEGPFADPKNNKWPLNTAARVRNAWARINQEDATKNYSADEIATMKGRIRSAAKDKGVELSEDGSKEFTLLRFKQMGDQMTPQDRAQAIHDMALELGAGCGLFDDDQADEMKSAGTQPNTKEFSQAPEAHPNGSDSTADQAKEASDLARAKALVMSLQTRHLVTEGE